MYHLPKSFSEVSRRSKEAKSGRLDFTLWRNKNFALAVAIGTELTVVWTSKLLGKKQCLNLQRLSLTAYCSQKFLGVFSKLRKAAIKFVMSVCRSVHPSVRPHGTSWLPPN